MKYLLPAGGIISTVVAFFANIGGALDFVKNYLVRFDALRFWISDSIVLIETVGEKTTAWVAAVPFYGFFVFLMFCVGAAIFVRRQFMRQRRKSQITLDEVQREADFVNDELNNIINNFNEIVHEMYGTPDESIGRMKLSSVWCEHDINANGDTKVTRILTGKCGPERTHFIVLREFADPCATSAETLREIQLKAFVNGKKTKIIPLNRDMRTKHFAVFFQNGLNPDEDFEIETSFFWKGYFSDMRQRIPVTYELAYRPLHQDDAAQLTLIFDVPKELGTFRIEDLCAQLSVQNISYNGHNHGERIVIEHSAYRVGKRVSFRIS